MLLSIRQPVFRMLLLSILTVGKPDGEMPYLIVPGPGFSWLCNYILNFA